jgi:hypothetical protein
LKIEYPGGFGGRIHQPLDSRVVPAAFGGFRCALSTLRKAVESTSLVCWLAQRDDFLFYFAT